MSPAAGGSASGPEDGPGSRADSDRELLARHADGDPEAFNVLFTRHRDRLWAVALRTLGDPEQAADALQDAMVSAVRRAGSFRGDAQVTSWLHRIVVNACIDHVRRARVRAADPLPDAAADLDRMPALAITEPHDPADRLSDRTEVQSALATLPMEQRAALVLVDMEGYSVAEAAVMLDCAEGTVKSRCARGRTKLAPLLRQVWNPDAAPGVSPQSRPGRQRTEERHSPPTSRGGDPS
ncbi:MAG TPA: RNA polymerase sigma factor SigM [Nocardioidaceae bacterium]|nr:RNA polymerase sigma factor SigM [Nocardioidaceae bacterium]